MGNAIDDLDNEIETINNFQQLFSWFTRNFIKTKIIRNWKTKSNWNFHKKNEVTKKTKKTLKNIKKMITKSATIVPKNIWKPNSFVFSFKLTIHRKNLVAFLFLYNFYFYKRVTWAMRNLVQANFIKLFP